MDHTDHCKFACDFTDGEDPLDDLLRDKGCCTPPPVKRTCLAPVLPVPQCGDAGTISYDPETEEYFALGTMYDKQCSPWWTTSIGDPWMALIR